MSIETIVIGEWSPYRHLSAEDQAVFQAAVEGLIGVDYSPVEVSTQDIVERNYRYRCDAQTHDLANTHWMAIVEIFNPLKGKPYIESIEKEAAVH